MGSSVKAPAPPPPKMNLQPKATNAMTARISMTKMTISMPLVIDMPRMVTNVLNATKAMTHTYHGLPGISNVPQFATMTYSNAGERQ